MVKLVFLRLHKTSEKVNDFREGRFPWEIMDELYELLVITGEETLHESIPVPGIKFDLWKMYPAKARFRFRFAPTRS